MLLTFALLCEVIQRRFVTLREADVSTWGQLLRPLPHRG